MHLLTVFQGRYKAAATTLAGETFAFGIRWVAKTAPIDPIGALPSDSDVYPFPATHNRNETNWTIVGNWSLEAGINDLDPADWLHDQLAPAMLTFFGTTGLFVDRAFIETIKVYPIGSDGRAMPAPPYSTGTPVTLTMKTETVCDGQSNGNMIPPQVALVASMLTAQIGPSGRGRIFLPALSVSNQMANGTLDATRQAAIVPAVAQWLTGSAIYPVAAGVEVAPAVVPAAQSAPSVYALINTVRVDSIFDTQRRRRRSLVGTRVSATVPVP